MALYLISSKEIHDKYHEAENYAAKNAYKEILRLRAERGSSEARYYFNLINRSLEEG